ncbi:hypothetical protein CON35_08775 [Bacillus cereus]|nr:hypothetical protein CON35_08775 [Bacillus cereus]
MISKKQLIVSWIDCAKDGPVYPPSQSIFVTFSSVCLCLSHICMAPSRSVIFAAEILTKTVMIFWHVGTPYLRVL